MTEQDLKTLETLNISCGVELANYVSIVSKQTGVARSDVLSVLAWLALRPMLRGAFELPEERLP